MNSTKSNKLHLIEGKDGVFVIQNLTGVGPLNLHEIVISLTNRDMYTSKDPEEMKSKFGTIYISGYQGNKIINDFYKIMFDTKELANKVINDYANS
jgi:hypothetical protein